MTPLDELRYLLYWAEEEQESVWRPTKKRLERYYQMEEVTKHIRAALKRAEVEAGD